MPVTKELVPFIFNTCTSLGMQNVPLEQKVEAPTLEAPLDFFVLYMAAGAWRSNLHMPVYRLPDVEVRGTGQRCMVCVA